MMVVAKQDLVEFKDAKVEYHDSELFGLQSVSVWGYVENTGSDDPIDFSLITLESDADFLVKNYFAHLRTAARGADDNKLDPGEKVEFYCDLGGTKAEMYPSDVTGDFYVKYDGVVNDRVGMDVSPYYEIR